MGFSKNLKKRSEFFLTPLDHSRKTGIVFLLISVFVHGLFFYGMVFFQDFRMPKPMPPVIQVDLVSFSPEIVIEEPAESETNLQNEGVPQKTQTVKKKNRKIPTIKPDISLKTKPKNLKDLVARQEKKKKKPVKKIKPVTQIKDPEFNKIAMALNRLQKKVKEQGKRKEDADRVSVGYGQKGVTSKKLYHSVIAFAIQQNWVFNETLANLDQNLEVRILIKILKNGEIRDVFIETRSGNRYLDESAKKAILKASPLPELPKGYNSYDVFIGFTPKGLKG